MFLKASNISKKIKSVYILKNISLELEGGFVYGFAGRNGAGKTMLFRALSGLIGLSEGAVYLNDKKLGEDFSVLPNLGIVLENAGLYPQLTGFENLKYLASFKNAVDADGIRKTIARVGLDPSDKRLYRKYSLGMKQRLAIAQAVMEKPDIIMLDEPTNGLDSDGVERIRRLILEEKERGAIILLASHSHEDLTSLSDRVFKLEHGAIIGDLWDE